MKRKVPFVLLASALLLTLSACGYGNGKNLSPYAADGNGSNNINSIGGIGGDRADVKAPVAPVQPADIVISPGTSSMAVDSTMQLTATNKDASGGKLVWSSSEPGVATVNDAGVATGVSAGTTQITATAGGKTSPPFALTLCDYRHL